MVLHEDEIPVDVALVRRLVDRQFPEHAPLGLRPMGASGSSNALFRLGSDLLVRLPRQPGGSATIEKEARWMPLVGARLPVPVPRVVGLGEPDLGYPERWSLTTWLDGHQPPVVVDAEPPGESREALAHDLAHVVVGLRELPVPAAALRDPSLSWYRGGPLGPLDTDFRQAVDACRRLDGVDLDLDAVQRV
jgi:aminoglycoside phosphotransferase (APT) family kinase protein